MSQCPPEILTRYPNLTDELLHHITESRDIICLHLAHPQFSIFTKLSKDMANRVMSYLIQRDGSELTSKLIGDLIAARDFSQDQLNSFLIESIKLSPDSTVQRLIKLGANVHWNGHPLMTAIVERRPELVDLFLKVYNVDLHIGGQIEYQGRKIIAQHDLPLLVAVALGETTILETLIQQGADLHTGGQMILPQQSITADNHDFAISLCLTFNHPRVLEILLKYGMDPNTHGGTPLIWASNYGQINMVKVLLKYGANVHSQNNRALMLACLFRHLAVIDLLLKYNADPVACLAYQEDPAVRRILDKYKK